MIILDEYEFYKYYIALKLHFTTDKYDVIKYNGRTKVSRKSFEQRRDLYFIRKIVKKLNEKDIVNFLVANFVSGEKWGGFFDSTAETKFNEWQKRVESLTYVFGQELLYLDAQCESLKKDFRYIFDSATQQHPIVLQAYLAKKISIETVIILNDLHPFIDTLDKSLYNDVIWTETSRLCKKYKPFLKYDQRKINEQFAHRS